MSNFKNIKRLGLTIFDYKEPHHHFAVDAEELETLLQSAQVVKRKKDITLWTENFGVFTFEPDEQALLIGITPLKKQTKAEAALEFIREIEKLDHGYFRDKAKKILEMKDEV